MILIREKYLNAFKGYLFNLLFTHYQEPERKFAFRTIKIKEVQLTT